MNSRSIVLNVVMPIVVLVGTMVTIKAFMASRPVPPSAPTQKIGQVVNVVAAEEASGTSEVKTVGRVKAARELTVMPEVSGRLVELHANLQPGGVIAAGDTIVKIDDRAYRLMTSQQEANAAAARVDLQVEGGRRSVAEREWALLEGEVQATADGKDLALRKPYQRLAQVKVAGARAALERARLDVERTTVTAPFNALVREESVELGMLVGPQSMMARLVGTDAFWVEVSVPFDDLARIDVPRPGQTETEGSTVVVSPVRNTGNDAAVTYEGRVIRLLGDLDSVGAQARMIVEVPDPLGLISGREPLLLNSFVDVAIRGATLPDSVRLPRIAVREGDIVWVLNTKGELEIRPVVVIAREVDSVLVASGVRPNERVITSRLSAPVPGMKLRIAGEAEVSTKTDAPADPAAAARGAQ